LLVAAKALFTKNQHATGRHFVRWRRQAKSAVELARAMLQKCENNLIALSRLSVDDLIKFKGIGEAKALSIVAALELGLRRRHSEVLEKQVISSSKDAFELFYPYLTDSHYEPN
jgi:DNA repair protein RadC